MNTEQINHQTDSPLFIDEAGTIVDLTNALSVMRCSLVKPNTQQYLYEVTLANQYIKSTITIRANPHEYQLLINKFDNVINRRLGRGDGFDF